MLWQSSPLMLVISEESMGSPIYFLSQDGFWQMAKGFDPAPAAFAFVTDKSWIMAFHDFIKEGPNQ